MLGEDLSGRNAQNRAVSAVAVRSLPAGVPLRLPVVELNGAFLTELGSGRHLAHRTLGPEAVLPALARTATPASAAWAVAAAGVRTAALIAFVRDEEAGAAGAALEGGARRQRRRAGRSEPLRTGVDRGAGGAPGGGEGARRTAPGGGRRGGAGAADRVRGPPQRPAHVRGRRSAGAPANAHPDVRARATDIVAFNDEDGVVRFLPAGVPAAAGVHG
ncbi:hypothetical protein [Streptomyces sp. NPDC003036]|uniref:hypothetical protein n=1 Tax=Streptomyces sp. NPDC003036 TaxID=3154442 RepID=UPI0033A1DB36